MSGEWSETDRQTDRQTATFNCDTCIEHVGNEAKDDPLKDFSSFSGTGTGHEA